MTTTHSFRISEDDYAAAVQLHARPRGWRLVLLIGLAVMCMALVFIGRRPAMAAGLGGLIGLAAVLALLHYVVGPWLWRRHYRRYPAIQDEITLEVTDDGFRVHARAGESRVTWPQVFKWRENDRFVLVYVMPIMFHMIPKSLAQQGFDLEGFRHQIAQHKGPAV